jgi:sugar phosphate isomerase/epimerase
MQTGVRKAIQLYSVRDLQVPLPEVLGRVSEFGFEGVEFADRFQEADPDVLAAALEETGLEVLGVHADLATIEGSLAGENDLVRRCLTVGATRLIIPHVSPRHVRTESAARSLSLRLARLARQLNDYGIELGYHNSEHDFWPFLPEGATSMLDASPLPGGLSTYASKGLSRAREGSPVSPLGPGGFGTLVERVPPENFVFELDVPKVAAAGVDPAEVIAAVPDRVSLVHLGDIDRTGRLGTPVEVPVGEGIVDVEGVLEAAAEAGVEWAVYENELDHDPTTKLEDGASLFDRLVTPPPPNPNR